jgi:hypothetical protein
MEGTKDREERRSCSHASAIMSKTFVFDQIRLEKHPGKRYGSLTDFNAGGILPL